MWAGVAGPVIGQLRRPYLWRMRCDPPHTCDRLISNDISRQTGYVVHDLTHFFIFN